VGKAAHAAVEEAVNAGVWVFRGGMEQQRAAADAYGRSSGVGLVGWA
jgi:hypothetical protein